MDDTAVVGENVEVIQISGWGTWGAISRGAVIAGAMSAMVMSILVVSLDSGIGLAVTSPYDGGSLATALTIAGAVWISVGFAQRGPRPVMGCSGDRLFPGVGLQPQSPGDSVARRRYEQG